MLKKFKIRYFSEFFAFPFPSIGEPTTKDLFAAFFIYCKIVNDPGIVKTTIAKIYRGKTIKTRYSFR